MNLEYKEFMKEKIGKNYVGYSSIKDVISISHGSDKKSFKKAYEEVYGEEDIKIFHLDNPKTLRFGFIVDHNNQRMWHTVRVNAWGSHENLIKDIIGE